MPAKSEQEKKALVAERAKRRPKAKPAEDKKEWVTTADGVRLGHK